MSTDAPHRRTLWEEGRHPGPLVAAAAALLVLVVAALDLTVFDEVTVLTDIVFVLVCVAAALTVRPRDFFVVGVSPPLVMLGAFAVLALQTDGAFGARTDGFVQAVVSGLAHHATSLVVGYALTLGLLAVRQLAARNAGVLRNAARSQSPERPAGAVR